MKPERAPRRRGPLYRSALVATTLSLSATAQIESARDTRPDATVDSPETPLFEPRPVELPREARDPSALGPLSIARPNTGFLINARRMPKGKEWVLSVPEHAFGTAETVANLVHCIRRVSELFEDTPPVMIGSISARNGGPLPPHVSHRTGRDVDIYFYRKPGTQKWFEKATGDDLDAPRTWALLRTIITDTDVEFVLIDRFVKELLEKYALSIGEDPSWISALFRGEGEYKNPLIKHVPGHTAHMHVRFVSAAARERGRLAYDQLVEQGHVTLPSKELSHLVVRGDTLIGLSRKYRLEVSEIQRLNGLETTLIRVGQKLKLRERTDLLGAREPVIVPRRRLPPPRSAEAMVGHLTNEISAVGAAVGAVTLGER